MRNILLLVIISFSALADWQSDVGSINNQLIQGPFFSNAHINNQHYGLGWKSFSTENVTNLKTLSDGYEYYWDDSVEHMPSVIKRRDPYVNDSNEAWNFDLGNSRDNNGYYFTKTDAYYASGTRYFRDDIPDQKFLNYPNMGNMYGAMTAYADLDGFGISDVQDSAKTRPVRNRVSQLRDSLTGMESNSNVNDYTFTWDFSSLGQILVDRQICLTNPFLGLQGGFRVKPKQGDYLYSVWNTYFNKDNSFGNNLRHAILFFAYGFLLVYVINDLMSIIGA